jgi:glyoxylase-like metal-dependent hydrolase (beta-lactamase superfamily II)
MKTIVIPVTIFDQNCTLLWCTQTMLGAFVDPGGDIDQLISVAKENNVTIEKILITHGHLDHAGGAAELAERLSVPIEGPHKDDDFWIQQLPEQTVQFGFPEGRTFTPERWLQNADKVRVGNLNFDVIHCPGHTPGHVVFYQPDEHLALVGDVLFQGSIGRTDFPRGNHQDLLDSITGRLWPLGDDVAFIPGHGQASTFGAERKTNPYVGDDVI